MKREIKLDKNTLKYAIKIVTTSPYGDNIEIRERLERAYKSLSGIDLDLGDLSDGYHTFNELYEHRHLLFSKIAEWKSKFHSDGTMFDGWFIAGIGKENGKQITYHIPMRLWGVFSCEELEKAPEWDGHTSNDVLKRLILLQNNDGKRKQ